MSNPLLQAPDVPALPFPQFPETLSTRIATAVVGLFAADETLRDFFAGRIMGLELEELLLSEETIFTPTLPVFLNGIEQRRDGSNHRAMRRTLIQYGVLRGPSEQPAGSGYLTQRIVDYTITKIYASGAQNGGAGGILYDAAGNPLTVGLEVIQRVPKPVLLPGLEKFLLTRVDAVFTNWVREDTGEIAYE